MKLDIRITDGKKNYDCSGVYDIEYSGNKTGKNKKADIILKGDKDHHISIKKDNAEIWESADKFLGKKSYNIVQDLLKRGKVKLLKNEDGICKIQPNICFNATLEEKQRVVFGSDIFENGCVIQKTFDYDLGYYKDNILHIPVTKIITSLDDLDSHDDVYFLIRNDSTRKVEDIKGLRILAVFKKRINKNCLDCSEWLTSLQ